MIIDLISFMVGNITGGIIGVLLLSVLIVGKRADHEQG